MADDWIHSETEVLVHYLNKNRNAVVQATEGLTDAQMRTPGVPSGTNLLGLVRHLTGVEEHWFQLVFLDEGPASDDSMAVPAGTTRAEVVAAYRRACTRSDEILRASPDLSMPAKAENPGEPGFIPLRVIAAHMVEETARHAGHADILREQIDGTTYL